MTLLDFSVSVTITSVRSHGKVELRYFVAVAVTAIVIGKSTVPIF